jgi:hypothetical protein
MDFPKHLIHLIESLLHDQQAAITIAGDTLDWFEVQIEVRQECILLPYLFNIYAENIMRNVRSDDNYDSFDALKVGGIKISKLRYADDTVLLAHSSTTVDNFITSVKKHIEDQNLYINIQKTKILSTDKSKHQPKIVINVYQISVHQ